MKLTFVTSAPADTAADLASDPAADLASDPAADSVDVVPPAGGKPRESCDSSVPQPERDLATTAPTSPTALSYSALAPYERCGYRFYAERVLGLPQLPTGAEPTELVE